MTVHEYDPDLPHVVEVHGVVQARFRTRRDAENFLDGLLISGSVIDTTPKPRVPEDARWVTWYETGNIFPHYARRTLNKAWIHDEGTEFDRLEDLPGVTPDTVFTVLDERKS